MSKFFKTFKRTNLQIVVYFMA